MVRITSGLPAFTAVGLMDERVGAGLKVEVMTNLAAPELPPPGEGLLMLSFAAPEFAMSAAVI